MRYSLLEYVRPELATRIEGTTDSEWIYALVLSQLDDPYGLPDVRELADATAGALRIPAEGEGREMAEEIERWNAVGPRYGLEVVGPPIPA
jgi:glutamine amidotransferase